MGVGGHHALAAFTTAKDLVPIVQEAGWAPGLVWIGAENLAPTGIRSPDLPARSESLYRIRYPGPQIHDTACIVDCNTKVDGHVSINLLMKRVLTS
jgi:hypothetical protein